MADESDPRRIDKLVRPRPDPRVAPTQPIEPIRPRDQVLRTYRRVFEPQRRPEATDAAHILVRQVMAHPPVVIDPRATLAEAHELLERRDIRHLPVVEDGLLVGLLTRRLLAQPAMRGDESWRARPVSDVMIRQVATVAPNHTLREAAEMLTEGGWSGLPVVRSPGEVVGFITSRDLLQVLVRKAPVTLWV